MANLPQNTGYNTKNTQKPTANFSSLKKTMKRYDPERAARLFTPTSGIGQKTPSSSAFKTGEPVAQQQPGRYQAIPDYVRFAKADERGLWTDPTEAAKIRNFPEHLGGGQYTVDPTQRGELIKSERTLVNKKFNPKLRKELLDGRPSSMFEVDHTIPLWIGGSDTLANVSVLDKATHKRKTAAQAVPLTLLANKKINLNQAKAMAFSWEEHDTTGLPDPDRYGGYVPLEIAEKYAKKWEEDRKTLDTSKYFGEAFREEMSGWGEGWLPVPIREFGKGLVGGGTAGIAPGTHASEDTGMVGSASNLAGHIISTIIGLGVLSRGIGMGVRGTRTALGLTKTGKAAATAVRGAKTVLDARKAAGIAKNAIVPSRLADVGKLTFEGIKTAARARDWRIKMEAAARSGGLLGLWGQIGLTGIDITGQQEIELEDRIKQAMMDMAFGGLLGVSGQTLKGYATVGVGTATLSLIGGANIETAFKDAALMTALHGMGYRRSKRLGKPSNKKAGKIEIGGKERKFKERDITIGEEEAYKVSTEKFYDHVGNLVPRVKQKGEVPKVLKYETKRIEDIKEYTGETNINNTAEAIDALYFKARRNFESDVGKAKGKISEEKIRHEIQGLEVARNELKKKTLPVEQQKQKTMEDLLSIGEKVRTQFSDADWRELARKTEILNEMPFKTKTERNKIRYENPKNFKFPNGETAGTGFSKEISTETAKNVDTIARKTKDKPENLELFVVSDPQTQRVVRFAEKAEIAKEGESGTGRPEDALRLFGRTEKNGELVDLGYVPQPYKFEKGSGYGINQTPYEISERLKHIVVSNKPAEMKAKLEKDRANVSITEQKAEELFNRKKEIKKMTGEEIYNELKPQTSVKFYSKELNNSAIAKKMREHDLLFLRVDPAKVWGKEFSKRHKEPYISFEFTDQNWLRSIAEQKKSTTLKARETEPVTPEKFQNLSETFDTSLAKKIENKLTKLYPEIKLEYTKEEIPFRAEKDPSIFYQLSTKNRKEFQNQIAKKRPDLVEKGVIDNVLDEIGNFADTYAGKINENPSKLERIGLHWTTKGNVILPEDAQKMMTALKTARARKIDPFQHNSPDTIIERFAGKLTEERVNPDTLKSFTNKKEIGDNITVYDVAESRQGQIDTRKTIDTHFGNKSNSWCVAQKDINTNKLTGHSWKMWEYYGPGKKIAFRNNKLEAFYGGGEWHDKLNLSSRDGIPITKKVPNDTLKRKRTVAVDPVTGKEKKTIRFFKGDPLEGKYEEWYLNNPDIKKTEYTKKNGNQEGLSREWYENGQLRLENKWKNGEIEGPSSSWYENGQLEFKGNYKNGRQEGLFREWYENGQLRFKGNYKNGRREGFDQGWYENGQLRFEGKYKNGEEEGLHNGWYENGQLRFERNYKNGKIEGPSSSWYENGQLRFEEKYKNGRKEGLFREWYENGKLEFKGNYKDGKREGLFRSWYENGQLKFEGNYKNGKREGLNRDWFENGQLSFEGNFKDSGKIGLHNRKEGLFREWYENGQLKFEGNYKNGNQEGLFRMWYENGQLKFEKNLKNGRQEGLSREWYENGQLKFEENYKNGRQEGLSREWYENGQLKYEENYKNGRQVFSSAWDKDGKRLKTKIKIDDSPLYQFHKGKAIGRSDIKAKEILIDAVNQRQDTLPHEYAHHYVSWFKDTAIVKEGIKRYGSEEKLVQKVGEQTVAQKGDAFNWWQRFSKWLLDLGKDKDVLKVITDNFLSRGDLRAKQFNRKSLVKAIAPPQQTLGLPQKTEPPTSKKYPNLSKTTKTSPPSDVVVEYSKKPIISKTKGREGKEVSAQADYKNNRILVNKKEVQKTFEEKAWTKPKMEGVKPLPKDQFKTAKQWENFLVEHERAHFKPTIRNIKKSELRENEANRYALESLSKKTPKKTPKKEAKNEEADFINEHTQNIKSRLEDIHRKAWETPEEYYKKLKRVINANVYNIRNEGFPKEKFNKLKREIKNETEIVAKTEVEKIDTEHQVEVGMGGSKNPLLSEFRRLKKKEKGTQYKEDPEMVLSKGERKEMKTLDKNLSEYKIRNIETRMKELQEMKNKTEANKKEFKTLKQEHNDLMIQLSRFKKLTDKLKEGKQSQISYKKEKEETGSELFKEEDPGAILSKTEKQQMRLFKKAHDKYIEIGVRTEKLLEKQTLTKGEKKELETLQQKQKNLLLPYSGNADTVLSFKYGLKLQDNNRFLDFKKNKSSKTEEPVFSDKFKEEHNVGNKTPYEFWGNFLKKDIKALKAEKNRLSRDFIGDIKKMEKSPNPYAKGFAKMIRNGLEKLYGSKNKKTEQPLSIEESWTVNSIIKRFLESIENEVERSQFRRRIVAQVKAVSPEKTKRNIRKEDIKTREQRTEEQIKIADRKARQSKTKERGEKGEEIPAEELIGLRTTPEKTKTIEDISAVDEIFKRTIHVQEARKEVIKDYNNLTEKIKSKKLSTKSDEYKEMEELFETVKFLSRDSYYNETKKWKLGEKVILPNEGKPTFNDGVRDAEYLLLRFLKDTPAENRVTFNEIKKEVFKGVNIKETTKTQTTIKTPEWVITPEQIQKNKEILERNKLKEILKKINKKTKPEEKDSSTIAEEKIKVSKKQKEESAKQLKKLAKDYPKIYKRFKEEIPNLKTFTDN